MNEIFSQILISSKDDHEDKNYYHDPSITQQDGYGFKNHWNLWETIKRERERERGRGRERERNVKIMVVRVSRKDKTSRRRERERGREKTCLEESEWIVTTGFRSKLFFFHSVLIPADFIFLLLKMKTTLS